MNLSKNKIIAGVIGLVAVVGVVNTQAIVKLSKVNGASYSQSAQVVKATTSYQTQQEYKKGDRSDIIQKVQGALTEQGFYKSDISGLFGPRTEAAVKAFQLTNRLPATGVLDLKTQDAILKINRGGGNDTILPPCGRLSDPWIMVTSPNGGEVYQAGQQINVTWRSCKIPADTTARIAFSSQFEGGNSQNVITPNTGSVSYEIPSTTSFPPLEYGNYYKIYIDFPSLNVQGDMSDNFFSITEGEGCAEGTIIGYNSDGTPIYCGDGDTGIGENCPQYGPLLIATMDDSQPIALSSDQNQITSEQVITRLWLYPICDLTLYNTTIENNGNPSIVNSTPWTPVTSVFSNYHVYAGDFINTSILLGETPAVLGGVTIDHSTPLQLYANQPQQITLTVDVIPEATGTAQTCFFGFNMIPNYASPLGNEWSPYFNNTNKLLGRAICQNKVSIVQ